MANDFVNVHFEDRIFPPSEICNTLFTPSLPHVMSLKTLVTPEYDGNGVQPEHDGRLPLEETAPLQALMGLNNDTATFVKIILMFAEVAAEHLDLSKGYLEQGIPSKVAYLTKIASRFPKFEDYFVDGWPAYTFAKIYLDQLEDREERRRKQELQAKKIWSIVQSVCELLQPSRSQVIEEGSVDY